MQRRRPRDVRERQDLVIHVDLALGLERLADRVRLDHRHPEHIHEQVIPRISRSVVLAVAIGLGLREFDVRPEESVCHGTFSATPVLSEPKTPADGITRLGANIAALVFGLVLVASRFEKYGAPPPLAPRTSPSSPWFA